MPDCSWPPCASSAELRCHECHQPHATGRVPGPGSGWSQWKPGEWFCYKHTNDEIAALKLGAQHATFADSEAYVMALERYISNIHYGFLHRAATSSVVATVTDAFNAIRKPVVEGRVGGEGCPE